MAILFESDSPIELLLKDALLKTGIDFQEQYRIYENPNALIPKYVVDFLARNGERCVVIECDGSSWHSSDFDARKSVQRDNWLNQHGYKTVLHFTSYQIKYEMEVVVSIIKHNLGIEFVPKKQRSFHGKRKRTTYINNIPNAVLHRVELHYACMQMFDKVWLVYKYQDLTLNRFSEERIQLIINVPRKMANELAVYISLRDLKRSVNLLVHCHSEWLTAYCNKIVKKKKEDGILDRIDNLLLQHNYLFSYLNMQRDISHYDTPSDAQFISSELSSRCKQIRYKYVENAAGLMTSDFSTLFS